jgi:multidrug efflux pump subunit AcrA (membrane-fusion protein)
MKYLALALSAALLWMAASCGKLENEENERREQAEKRERAEKTERAEAKPDENLVKLGEEAIASSDLRTVEVRADSGLVTARFPGRIEFNQNATAVVQAQLEGRLQEWLINVGDRVKKGQALARVESPQNLSTPILLKAPLDGEIIERNAALGDWVKPGDKLAVITELGKVWAVARVREDMVGKILTDEPATIRVLSFPGDTFTGKLLRVAASVDPQTRTVDFLFAVSNLERKLRAGMFAQVSLATDRVQDKLLVPDEAVQTVRGRSVVFIEQQRGQYRIAPVRLGPKLGGSYVVLDGLSSRLRVVTTGSFVLKSETLRSEFAGEQD